MKNGRQIKSLLCALHRCSFFLFNDFSYFDYYYYSPWAAIKNACSIFSLTFFLFRTLSKNFKITSKWNFLHDSLNVEREISIRFTGEKKNAQKKRIIDFRSRKRIEVKISKEKHWRNMFKCSVYFTVCSTEMG